MKNKAVPVKLEPVEIDDFTFHIPVLGIKAQRKILFKLSRIAGEPLADLVNNQIQEDAGESTVNVSAVFEALSSAFKSLQNPEIEQVYGELLEEFANDAKVEYLHESGEMANAQLKNVYDEIFHCKLDLEGQFLWACLEANFRPFFERVKGASKGALSALSGEPTEKGSTPKE